MEAILVLKRLVDPEGGLRARSGATGKPFDVLGGRRLEPLRAGRICPDLGASRLDRGTATLFAGPLDLGPNPPRQNGSI